MGRRATTKASRQAGSARAKGSTSRSQPASGARSQILALQQTAGNRAVSRALESDASRQTASLRETLMSEGQPLDPNLRTLMESRFGRGFGQVRVHTDPRAAESADAVKADAFTIGRDVIFGKAKYAPDTSAGKELLAHELAHVVQQSGAREGAAPRDTVKSTSAPGSALPVAHADAASEREADHVARRATAVTGSPAPPVQMSAAPAAIHRQPAAKPKEDEEFKKKHDAARAEEKKTSGAKAGQLRGQYDKEGEKLKEKGNFSALGMDQPHKQVPRTDTPMSEGEVKEAIMKSWRDAFGTRIPAKALGLLVAQWYAEGGHGEKGIHNYNIGNLQVDLGTKEQPKQPISDYSNYKAPEYTKGERTSPFASFDNPEQGALGLIQHVSERKALLAALLSGNPEHYVYVAKSYNYFEAPVEDVKVDGKKTDSGYLSLVRPNVPKPEKLTETGTKADILAAEQHRLEKMATDLGMMKKTGKIKDEEYAKQYNEYWAAWNAWSGRIDSLRAALPGLDKDIEPEMQKAVEKGRQRVVQMSEVDRSNHFRKVAALLPTP